MKLLSVNYHYIRNIKKNNGIFSITPKTFKNQINELGKYFEFIHLNQLKKIDIKTNKNFCILTFDDNLLEQSIAFEYLNKNNIPFISFCSSYPYIENKVLDVHKLHIIFHKLNLNEILDEIKNTFSFDIKNNIKSEIVNKTYSYGPLKLKKIKYFFNFLCKGDFKDKIIDYFFSSIVSDEKKFINKQYISKNMIKDLSKKDMLGSHSHSHRPLGKIKDFKKDIKLAHDFFKTLTNRKIQYFSYPYGRKGAYNNDVCKYLKNLRYSYAFTMNRGFEKHPERNPLLLKRIDTNDAPLGKLKKNSFYP